MKTDDKIEYLKNELKNYNFMKKWIENDSYIFDDRIDYYKRKIKDIDVQLNAGNAKGIDYNYIQTSSVHEPLLTLLAEQEKYIKRYNELIELKKKDVYGFKARVKYIEERLSKLDEDWKRNFIMDVYCYSKNIDEISYKYPYERRQLYRYKEDLIYIML